MSREILKVRSILPHFTAEGMKDPVDEYDRTYADADQLAELGVVEVVTTTPANRK
ncbi:MAG: hypothetical protein Q7T73_16170 [Beijerinckiaceae bacterium]|nr:hypothetical protein [Beijerinckiaceae bacterium]